MTDIKLGIRKKDKKITFSISTCIKFVNVNNLVNCNNQAIEMKIKKINVHDFKILKKTYIFILLIIIIKLTFISKRMNLNNCFLINV